MNPVFHVVDVKSGSSDNHASADHVVVVKSGSSDNAPAEFTETDEVNIEQSCLENRRAQPNHTLPLYKPNGVDPTIQSISCFPEQESCGKQPWFPMVESMVGVTWATKDSRMQPSKPCVASSQIPKVQLTDKFSMGGTFHPMLDEEHSSISKADRSPGVQDIAEGIELLRPGFEFVSWGEYGPPRMAIQQSIQQVARIVAEPEPSRTISPEPQIAEASYQEAAQPIKTIVRSRRVWCAALLIFGLAIVAVVVGTSLGGSQSPSAAKVLPVTTAMDPPTFACDNWYSQTQPSVLTQCSCIGKITVIADDIKVNYERLKSEGFVQDMFPGFASTIDSCDTSNQALLWLASATGSSSPNENYVQRFLMALLFITWNGRLWTLNEGWLSSDNECTWKGVSCNRSGEATGLDLYNNEVTGNLGSQFTLLSSLQSLSLGLNAISGSIPSEIGKLAELTSLVLMSNGLKGSLPSEIAELSLLTELRLGDNMLSGTLPTWFAQLSNLEILSLSNNTFIPLEVNATDGVAAPRRPAFPTEIGLLTNLQLIELSLLELNGTIPTELFNIGNLQALIIGGSFLTGTLPNLFGRFSSIGRLSRRLSHLKCVPGMKSHHVHFQLPWRLTKIV